MDSQVVLVAINLTNAQLQAIENEVNKQAKALPRVDIVRESVSKSLIVKATSVEEALTFSNDYAPEHLILHLENAPAAVKLVENAGSVFVGAFSPERYATRPSDTHLHQDANSKSSAVVITLPALITPCPRMVTLDSSVGLTPSPSKNTSPRKKYLPKV